MLDMAVSELDEAVEEEKRLQTLLLKSLLPKDEADERDCILEVRAGRAYELNITHHECGKAVCMLLTIEYLGLGTGGEEASLFAMDIFRM